GPGTTVLLGNGNGTFQSPSTIPNGQQQLAAGTADLNGYGRIDLVVTNWQTGVSSMSVMLNASNGNFTGQTYTLDSTAPFVQSINRANPAGPLTGTTTVSFAVTFSEAVTGVDA